jgi:hypothetical protein
VSHHPNGHQWNDPIPNKSTGNAHQHHTNPHKNDQKLHLGWKETPPISLAHLQLPRLQRGIQLLDLQARNQAIDITWIKSYLDLSPAHPIWSYTFDAIINCLHPSGIKCTRELNAFLTTPTRGPQTQRIPQIVTNLLRSMRQHWDSLHHSNYQNTSKNNSQPGSTLGPPQVRTTALTMPA